MAIKKSVGIGGFNNKQDIEWVQTSLNKLNTVSPELKIDGKLGVVLERSKTVAAIKKFQKQSANMIRPDGRIDVNGKTHRKIKEKVSFKTTSTPKPLTGNLKQILRTNLEKYENRIAHMYLDTRGYVTVGIGHMIPNKQKAKELKFVVEASGVLATPAEIESEYDLLKKQPFGNMYVARTFKKHTKLILSDTEINKITDKHINSFEKELVSIYGNNEFYSYPDKVKLALFDMIFNLGMTKLKNLFTNFNKHIKARDFKKAALECNRKGISSERNTYVKDLLRNSNG